MLRVPYLPSYYSTSLLPLIVSWISHAAPEKHVVITIVEVGRIGYPSFFS
jgi:hypothetical protein